MVVFDSGGSVLMEWSADAQGADQDFSEPQDVVVGPGGDVFVLFLGKVQKFSPAPVPAQLQSWGFVKAHYR